MEGTRSKFAGGDQAYLRDVQYSDSSKLEARARLHQTYGRGDWFPWYRLQVPWPTTGEVLDVGCGAGWLWADDTGVIPSGLRLTVTDLSTGMVEETVERASGAARFASVEGRTADASALPFDDARFAVVTANHMLYHLPDPRAGVREIARVLADDGVACVATNGVGHLRELNDINEIVFPGVGMPHETSIAFGIESGEPMLAERFDEVELRRHDDTLRCTDPDDVLAYLRSMPPGEDADDEHVRAMRDALDAVFATGDGVMEIQKSVGVFLCRGPHR